MLSCKLTIDVNNIVTFSASVLDIAKIEEVRMRHDDESTRTKMVSPTDNVRLQRCDSYNIVNTTETYGLHHGL